jgi:hypothetical protein
MELTVEELIEKLEKMPADAKVCLAVKDGDVEADAFTVELSSDGWVVLEGD